MNVRYLSPIARSQKLVDVASMDRYETTLAQEMAAGRTEVADNYDWDKAARRRHELLGVPQDLMVDEDERDAARRVCEIRVERAELLLPVPRPRRVFSDGLQDILAETERLVPTNALRPDRQDLHAARGAAVQDSVEHNRNLISGREVRERRARASTSRRRLVHGNRDQRLGHRLLVQHGGPSSSRSCRRDQAREAHSGQPLVSRTPAVLVARG
jgi:hypothetical protein